MSPDTRHEVILEVLFDGPNGVRATSDDGQYEQTTLDMLPLRRKTIELFMDHLDSNEVKTREELEVLGWNLYEALINGKVREFIDTQRDEARKEGQRLRLLLKFEGNQADLVNYPWEYLYDPNMESFLSTWVDMVLSRFMKPVAARQAITPEGSPLKILVVVSKPGNLGTVLAKDVLAAVDSFKNDLAAIGEKIQVEVFRQPTKDSLKNKLKEFKPHVFHFIGHGRYTGKYGEIALINPASNLAEADWIDDTILVNRFKQAQAFPQLVFLQMCEGAESHADKSSLLGFTGFAPRLLNAGIPAVVAMKYEIPNQDATQFSVAFYSALANYETIGAAIQAGRDSIGEYYSYRNRVFGTPTLYMISLDSQLTRPPVVSQPQKSNPSSIPGPPPSPRTQLPTVADGLSGGRLGTTSDVPASLPLSAPTGPVRSFPGQTGMPVITGQVLPAQLEEILNAGTEALTGLSLDKPQKILMYKRRKQIQDSLAGKGIQEVVAILEQELSSENTALVASMLDAMYLKAWQIELLARGLLNVAQIARAGSRVFLQLQLEKNQRLECYIWLYKLLQELNNLSLPDLRISLEAHWNSENDVRFDKALETMYELSLELND